MKPINVLFTCTSLYSHEYAECLTNNEDGTTIHTYAVNCDKERFMPRGYVEEQFLVPKITDEKYIPALLKLCDELNIDIIIPTATVELEMMSAAKETFEDRGVKVSVASEKCVSIANNKKELYKRYSPLMPAQVEAKSGGEIYQFYVKNKEICCKLSDGCGGSGFAIVDDIKAKDPLLFNRLGTERYISSQQLYEIAVAGKYDMLVQEYIEGIDYTVNVLAVKGNVTHIVGIAGSLMSYGVILKGKIEYNAVAYEIAEKITKELMLDGNACFDFRITPDLEVYLLEINPRVSASLSFVKEAGVNMLWLRCKNLLGDYSDVSKFFPIKYGLKMERKYAGRYYF